MIDALKEGQKVKTGYWRMPIRQIRQLPIRPALRVGKILFAKELAELCIKRQDATTTYADQSSTAQSALWLFAGTANWVGDFLVTNKK